MVAAAGANGIARVLGPAAELITKVDARRQAIGNLTVLRRVGLEHLLVCPLLLSAPLYVQQLVPPCMGRLRSQRRSLLIHAALHLHLGCSPTLLGW